MKYIREQDVEGDRIGPPHQRVIRHLITPENMGSKFVWLAQSVDSGLYEQRPISMRTRKRSFTAQQEKGGFRVDDGGDCI